jgi:hypothetical protein
VPPFDVTYLERGHAVHFRAGSNELNNVRIDIMSTLRGVDFVKSSRICAEHSERTSVLSGKFIESN